MRLLFVALWRLLNLIPGKYLINFLKGVLPSIWAFYILNYSSKENILRRYESLFHDRNLLWFIFWYVAVYVIFYFLIDFVIRVFILKKTGRSIYRHFSRKSKNISDLRELNELKSDFLKGMDLSIELGYLNRNDLLDIEVDSIIQKNGIEKALHNIGNLFCGWVTVLIHAILTLGLVYGMSWILVAALLIIILMLCYLIYASLILVISNINSIPKLKKEIERRL